MNATTVRIAWRNLSRNKRRTALAIGAIALGQFTLVFVNGLMAGVFSNMIGAITGPLIGHVQIHHPEWREERALEYYIADLNTVEAQINALPSVTTVLPRIFAPTLAAPGAKSEEPAQAEVAMFVGLDYASETQDGGLLEDVDGAIGPDDVLMGRILANRMGLGAGDKLAVIGQDADEFPVTELFTIHAIVDSQVDVVKTMGIVIPIERAQQLLALPDAAHELIVLGADYREADTLAHDVEGLAPLKDAEVLTWKEAMPEIANMMGVKAWIDFIFVGILFIAAAAGIANTAMMSTFERLREFGMLLALGAKPPRIVSMVLIESVILGVVGVVIGSIVGTAVVLITSRTGINYAAFGGSEAEGASMMGLNISYTMYPIFQFRQLAYGFIAVTLTSILASLWPASLAARLEPVRALRS